MRTDPPVTVVESFRRRVTATPRLLAWQHRTKRGWEDLTWRDAGQRVRAISSGLTALGVKPGERVAILSGTRVEWILAALGILSAGAAITTIYPSNTPEECAFVLADSGSRALIVENTQQLARLESVRADLGELAHLILIDGEYSSGRRRVLRRCRQQL
jgi:long-chain acyl-CoA synthetase